MTKQHSRARNGAQAARKNRQVIKPLWIAVGLILIGGMALLLLSNRAPESALVPIEVSGAPRVSVVQDKIDHGTVKYQTTVESDYLIRNVGDQDLVITNQPRVEVVEGCCPPQAAVSATTIKPGQQATLSIRFSMHEGMGGKHQFRVHLLTNDPQEPEKQLLSFSNWIP